MVSKELEISVIPVKTAYDMLEKDGYIYTVPGKGCFVKDLGEDLNRKKTNSRKTSCGTLAEFTKSLDLPNDATLALMQKHLDK